MKEKEAERVLRRALRFPRAWFELKLMRPEIAKAQLCGLRRHFGTRSRPVPSSEHWRYGAFRWLLASAQDDSALAAMLAVGYADSDPALGETMIKDIIEHPLAGSQVERANNALQRTRDLPPK
jgi:hypothetical protein